MERGPEGHEEALSVLGLLDTRENRDLSVEPFINPAFLHFVTLSAICWLLVLEYFSFMTLKQFEDPFFLSGILGKKAKENIQRSGKIGYRS